MTTENWGCPDWRDANAYPDEFELEQWQWRWEFLRRNPAYREAWNRAETAQTNENGSDIVWDKETVCSEDAKLNDLCRHKGFPCESDREIVEHIWHMGIMMLSPKTSLDSIGTQSIFNLNSSVLFSLPSFELIENYFAKNNFTPDHQVKILLGFLKQTLMISQMEREGKVALAKFDLSRRVGPQLKEAEKEIDLKLKRINNSINIMQKDNRSNWSRHLRVIDAKDRNVSHSEIANQFLEDGLAEEATLYKVTGNKETEKSRHKSIVNQWHNQARGIMAKAAILL